MDLPNQEPKTIKPIKEWQIIILILIAIIAIGFGEAIKKHNITTPQTPSLIKEGVTRPPMARTLLDMNGSKFTVELAITPEQQTQGLSGQAGLGENEGMLFVYPTSTFPSFWMKEMNFPLDIIWINADKFVIGYDEDVSPDTYPKTFSSDSVPVKYVLEVPAGTTLKNKLKIGDLIHFSLEKTL